MLLNIRNDKSCFAIICVILFLVFTNYAYGTKILLLTSVIFLINPNLFILVDKNVIVIFLFSIFFYFNQNLKSDYTSNFLSNIHFLFYPSLSYIIGKYIVLYYSNKRKKIIYFYIFIAIIFAFLPILSILQQLGNFTDGKRTMYLIPNKDFLISATVLGQFFVLTTIMIPFVLFKYKSYFVNLLLLVSSILSILCVLRLGNRTQLVLLFISFFLNIVLNYKFNTFKSNIYIMFLFFFGIITYNFIDINSNYFSQYSDRLNNKEAGIDSAGGRSEKWINSFNLLIENPTGWELSQTGYAHNLWLDTAREGGIISLVFISIITISFFINFYRFIKKINKKANENKNLKSFVIILGVCINFYFFVEPILDGMPIFFSFFLIFFGNLKMMNSFKTLKNI